MSDDRQQDRKPQGQPSQQGGKGRQQGQQQQQGDAQGQYGEGNYKATRDYNAGVKEHMQHHDVEKEARDAAPKDPQEQREMDEAERIGKSKSAAGPEKDMKGGGDDAGA